MSYVFYLPFLLRDVDPVPDCTVALQWRAPHSTRDLLQYGTAINRDP